jgi:hypothetical protein
MTLTDEQERKLRILQRRFVHRSDVFAHQWWNARSKRGGWMPVLENECTEGCKRYMCPHVTPRSLTPNDLVQHLTGVNTLGVYQLDHDDTVSWLCLDIDLTGGKTVDNSVPFVREAATRLRQTIRTKTKLPCLLEDSTNKGMHIWFFFEEPIPAAKALSLGRWIVGVTEPVEGIAVEVFPKQTTAKVLGNLVRLPLGIHKKTDRRSEFISWSTFEPLPENEQWDALDEYPSIPEDMVDLVLTRNKVEIAPRREPKSVGSDLVGEKTPKCYTHALSEGVKFGSQDVATFKLACYLRDRGVPHELTETMLQEWNKRNDPPMAESEVSRKIESAFSSAYSPYPCQEQAFDSICFKDCFWYASKMRTRGVPIT